MTSTLGRLLCCGMLLLGAGEHEARSADGDAHRRSASAAPIASFVSTLDGKGESAIRGSMESWLDALGDNLVLRTGRIGQLDVALSSASTSTARVARHLLALDRIRYLGPYLYSGHGSVAQVRAWLSGAPSSDLEAFDQWMKSADQLRELEAGDACTVSARPLPMTAMQVGAMLSEEDGLCRRVVGAADEDSCVFLAASQFNIVKFMASDDPDEATKQALHAALDRSVDAVIRGGRGARWATEVLPSLDEQLLAENDRERLRQFTATIDRLQLPMDAADRRGRRIVQAFLDSSDPANSEVSQRELHAIFDEIIALDHVSDLDHSNLDRVRQLLPGKVAQSLPKDFANSDGFAADVSMDTLGKTGRPSATLVDSIVSSIVGSPVIRPDDKINRLATMALLILAQPSNRELSAATIAKVNQLIDELHVARPAALDEAEARLAIQSGRFADAVAWLTDELRRPPMFPWSSSVQNRIVAHALRAHALAQAGDTTAAERDLQCALRRSREDDSSIPAGLSAGDTSDLLWLAETNFRLGHEAVGNRILDAVAQAVELSTTGDTEWRASGLAQVIAVETARARDADAMRHRGLKERTPAAQTPALELAPATSVLDRMSAPLLDEAWQSVATDSDLGYAVIDGGKHLDG